MITLIIVGCLIAVVVYILILDQQQPEGMPPGMWGLPIIGHLPSKKYSSYQTLQMYQEKYGKIFTLKVGSNVFVYLNDWKIIKEAFSNPLICDRLTTSPFAFLAGFKKAGIANNCGHAWSNIRRFSLRYLKENGMGKSSLEDSVLDEAECLVKVFKNHLNTPTIVPWSTNVAVINTLWRIVANTRYDLDNKKIQEFEHLLTDILVALQAPRFLLFNYYPWLGDVIPDFIIKSIIFKEPFRKLKLYQDFFAESIKDHQKDFDVNDQKDFIDVFLAEMNLNEQGKGTTQTDTFTEKELLYTLSDLFAGGSETTSSTLRWFVLLMAKHQHIQEKVQNQIDKAVDKNRLPNLSDRENLPYLEAVIHEVMRLKTLVPLGVFHSASQDTTIGKYHIPKGTTVISNIVGCHFDPAYWENPTEFVPERFILPDGSFNKTKESFLPFSIGKRACPGESLARMELYIFTGAFLQNFTFKPAKGESLEFELGPSLDFLAIPSESIKIIISERI